METHHQSLKALEKKYLKNSKCEKTNPTELRAMLVEDIKPVLIDVRTTAEQILFAQQDGRECAVQLSGFQDALIKTLFTLAVASCMTRQEREEDKLPAIVATGGYGRGLLAPHSDIDLLYLYPAEQKNFNKDVLDFLLYSLWDMGFKVGHAVRNLPECIQASLDDMTIATSLLDARFICGNHHLVKELRKQFRKRVILGRSRVFIEAKLQEREQRHSQLGDSRYLVEPNIKEGKGGLRDLHLLHWLVTFVKQDDRAVIPEHLNPRLLSQKDWMAFKTAEAFFWTIRCHLHFLTDKPEEKLSFSVQMNMAERMNYSEYEAPVENVERFMRDYFRTARITGFLTRTISSALELSQLKPEPVLFRLFQKAKQSIPLLDTHKNPENEEDIPEGFECKHGRVNITGPDIVIKNPVNLLRLFMIADFYQVGLHPEALHFVRDNLTLINHDIQTSPEANKLFLDFLTKANDIEKTLRHMAEAGVLGRFIPDFDLVDSAMQFNMYHHYTVGEHLIRSVGVLSGIDNETLAEDHPLSVKLIRKMNNKRLLYVALLLHDIAKGRPEDHSVAGAQVARDLCPRFGLNEEETETVAWLVCEHLTMSTIAQNRDIAAPKTIEEFAALVKTPERLQLLLILTVCDIRAVGPGVWNGWKGELLRNLYYATEDWFKNQQHGREITSSTKSDAHMPRELSELLTAEGLQQAEMDKLIERFEDNFWTHGTTDRLARTARLVIESDRANRELAYNVFIDQFTAQSEIAVYAPTHYKLLTMLTGACAAAGANIMNADINTTKDGMALDILVLERKFSNDEDENRMTGRILTTFNDLREGHKKIEDITTPTNVFDDRHDVFDVPTEIRFDNQASCQYTLIEISGLDQPGLLFRLTHTFSRLNLDIHNAHIATFGEKVVDTFYVTDFANEKICTPETKEKIRHALEQQINPQILPQPERKPA